MQVVDYAVEAVSVGPGPSSAHDGKFVHIIGPTDEYLVLSPVELTKYHAHVVQRFVRDLPEVSIRSSPSGEETWIDTPGWRVAGGGRFRFNRESRTLHLWGNSKAYGAFDGPHVRQALSGVPGWSDVSVHLGEPPVTT